MSVLGLALEPDDDAPNAGRLPNEYARSEARAVRRPDPPPPWKGPPMPMPPRDPRRDYRPIHAWRYSGEDRQRGSRFLHADCDCGAEIWHDVGPLGVESIQCLMPSGAVLAVPPSSCTHTGRSGRPGEGVTL